MDEFDGIPKKVLGVDIKVKTQITLACLVTAILELLIYLTVTLADIAVTIQHFRDGHRMYGSLTVTLLCLPAIICFISIMVSPWQWPEEEGCHSENTIFLIKQLFNLICFPIGALYRFSRRIFWSVEALFQKNNTYECSHAVSKAAETSAFELYHFLQAFAQSAPQIVLQLYIMLRENVFRNYETTHVQIVSIIFSLITMAIVTATYQRFESQKIVGRNYPWVSPHQAQFRQRTFRRTKSILEAPTIRPEQSYIELPESEHIMRRFKSMEFNENDQEDFEDNNVDNVSPSKISYMQQKSMNVDKFNFDENNTRLSELLNKKDADINKFNENNFNKLSVTPTTSDTVDTTVDNNKLQNTMVLNIKKNQLKPLDLNAIEEINDSSNEELNEIPINTIELDRSPEYEPPPPPPHDHKFQIINRLSTFKDMMFLNAELYIKDHVPRLPPSLFEHQNEKKCQNDDDEIDIIPKNNNNNNNNNNTADEVDFILPTRKKIVNGIEQDDFIGKGVAFTGWIMFLFMRILAISAFSVFFPWECLYLLAAHYLLMLCCIFYETKFHEKIERIYFYIFLAYIYIFCILEFKIKFKKPRIWYINYVGLVLIQNLTITLIWYIIGEFESWWFKYMFTTIMLSCVYSLICLLVYYFILKPNDKILIDNE